MCEIMFSFLILIVGILIFIILFFIPAIKEKRFKTNRDYLWLVEMRLFNHIMENINKLNFTEAKRSIIMLKELKEKAELTGNKEVSEALERMLKIAEEEFNKKRKEHNVIGV